jgi:hypothetical protein
MAKCILAAEKLKNTAFPIIKAAQHSRSQSFWFSGAGVVIASPKKLNMDSNKKV